MQIQIIKNSRYQTGIWAGGTTTQLFIFPENAKYSLKNFLWRLSTARVQASESEFTRLPGIKRILMILEGDVLIEHEGHHSAFLKPFQQDTFMGNWNTRSFGQGIDFNLMTAAGCTGQMELISVKKEPEILDIKGEFDDEYDFITEAFYCVQERAEIKMKDFLYCLEEGDLLMLTRTKSDEPLEVEIYNAQPQEMNIVRSRIYY